MRRLVATIAILAAGVLIPFGVGAGGGGSGYEIRGIFDNGGFLVPGEQVRVAGATVGSVSSVGVTRPGDWANRDHSDDPGKAVVVMRVTDPGFQDFRTDASCLIRPQSLLGEKYVDCEPTQPRAPGSAPPPPLDIVPSSQPGTGQHFLPLENNGKEVDLDLVQNIMREPYADRFRLILNDLGAGLAGRGKDLQAIVKRADPALRETDRVLAELASQNRQLSQLAANSDRVLAPLARERAHVAGFINNANVTAQATAQRSQDLEAGLQRFPGALRQLRATMIKLQSFSTAATPVFSEFRAGAPAIARATQALGPFAHAATPALVSLGDAAAKSQQPIVKSDPILKKVRDLAQKSAPGAESLATLLSSLRRTGGYRQLTNFIFNTVGSVNGFDQYGHFLRAALQVTNCTQLVTTTVLGCSANWQSTSGQSGKVDVAALRAAARRAVAKKAGAGAAANPDAQGGGAGGSASQSGGTLAKPTLRHGPSLGAARDLLDTVVGRRPQAGNGARP